MERNKAPSWALLVAAAVLIAAGLAMQEHLIVWKKAINICLECIGVG